MNIKVEDTVVVLKGKEKPQPTDIQDKEDAAKQKQRSEARVMLVTQKDGSVKEYKYGKVIKLFRTEGKVLVEGVNMVYKHMRKSRQNPRGGRLHKEMPIQLANVMLLCPSCNQPSRTGTVTKADGTKHRVCKKCKAEIGQINKNKKKASS
jgi:large subunit ribosomal protein L24